MLPRANRFYLVLGSCLLFAPLLTGCGSTYHSDNRPSDASISNTIKAKFAESSNVRPFSLDVVTRQGVVYLSGRVSEKSQKEEAAEIARDTVAVTDVVNEIQVGAS
jgi:hyperosmotically inducible protein